jgi:phosphopantothenoylcysteine decarboxylase/phosphopantothenate--cysteine ligase
MAAAVADYRLSDPLASKRKKAGKEWTVKLETTSDILSGLKEMRTTDHFVCGFAAETEDLKANAMKKLKEKGLDLVAANDVSAQGVGFDSDRNALTLLWPSGDEERIPETTKDECARALWDAIVEALDGR